MLGQQSGEWGKNNSQIFTISVAETWKSQPVNISSTEGEATVQNGAEVAFPGVQPRKIDKVLTQESSRSPEVTDWVTSWRTLNQ